MANDISPSIPVGLSAVLSRAVQVGGNITIAVNLTNFVEMAAGTGGPGTGGLDLTVVANAGDYIQLNGYMIVYGHPAGKNFNFDLATMVGGSPVNWVYQSAGSSATNNGLLVLCSSSVIYFPIHLNTLYVVQPADLTPQGTVTFRPYCAATQATSVARAVSQGPLILGATNLRH